MIAFITGSGFYAMEGFKAEKVQTHFGEATVLRGHCANGSPSLLLSRHDQGHRYLPHQINHRANLTALAGCGATCIISLSVCGVINPALPLAAPFLVDELYFPDNRLGDGSACTLFAQPGEKGRGHLLASSLYHPELTRALASILSPKDHQVPTVTYAHVTGPRFNTKAEIKALQQAGADILSQTCGPEAVLANELELPYAMVGYGVDYANGVQTQPTPINVLQENLAQAQTTFTHLIKQLREPEPPWAFQNFVYRFDL